MKPASLAGALTKNLRAACTAVAFALSGTGAYAQTPPLEKLDYLLPAPLNQIAFAPWVVAKQRGYYAQEGYDINLISGRGGLDVAKQIGAGNALIGHSFGDTPIITRPNGIPVKSVALMGGRSMMQVIAREDAGINSPKDLKGKTITAMSYSDANFYALLGVLASAGLKRSNVDAQSVGPTGVWQLVAAGKAQAMAGVPDWIADMQDAGVKIRIMPAYEYFGSMAQAILVTDDTAAKKPEFVRKIVRATLHGLSNVISDPAGAARDYVIAMPTYKGREAYVERVLGLYNEYVYQGQAKLGEMDPKRLAAVMKFYVDEGIVPSATPIDDLYSNKFLP